MKLAKLASSCLSGCFSWLLPVVEVGGPVHCPPTVAKSNQNRRLAKSGAWKVAVHPPSRARMTARRRYLKADSWEIATTTFSGMLKQPDKHEPASLNCFDAPGGFRTISSTGC